MRSSPKSTRSLKNTAASASCKLRDDGRVHGGGDTVVTISAVDTEDATGVTENTSRWLWLRRWLLLIQ